MRLARAWLVLGWLLLAAWGCSAGPDASQELPGISPNPDSTPTQPIHTAISTPQLSPTATPTSISPPQPSVTPLPVLERCSALQGITLAELPDRISNPFLPPRPGSDDPHQGIDLADLDAATRVSLDGRPVQAVFAGQVAAVVQDRFPYGNAILIETRLADLPAAWTSTLALPTPGPVQEGHPVLTCPIAEAPTSWDTEARSLYLIYAHLQSPPGLQPGTRVGCGDILGAIGMSGNALNPHLHLEARVGPAGATFPGMAHYIGNATPEEMRSYCQWRVSGAFQLVDPLPLLVTPP